MMTTEEELVYETKITQQPIMPANQKITATGIVYQSAIYDQNTTHTKILRIPTLFAVETEERKSQTILVCSRFRFTTVTEMLHIAITTADWSTQAI